MKLEAIKARAVATGKTADAENTKFTAIASLANKGMIDDSVRFNVDDIRAMLAIAPKQLTAAEVASPLTELPEVRRSPRCHSPLIFSQAETVETDGRKSVEPEKVVVETAQAVGVEVVEEVEEAVEVELGEEVVEIASTPSSSMSPLSDVYIGSEEE